ncbi:MAG: glycosyltransferase family 39 protein [Anaerolineales bacterium]|nr:glycosyltransferase family 39 protein [Anaerolineales bacterium]
MKNFIKKTETRIILILLVALFVRLLGIVSRPIWYDEAFSILFSEKGLGQMLYGTLAPTGAGSADIHPLGYYTLLWLWMKLFGESLVATRMLSIFAGIASVYLVHQVSKELFSEKTAETAMLITALAPFQIHYSQEIRMYAFLALWLLLTAYAYLRGSATRDWRWWIVFGIASALAQYTHNLAAFFLVPLAFIPLIKRDWRTLRSVTLASGFAILLYLPWLIQLPTQFAKIDQAYWVIKPNITAIFTLLLVFTTNTPLPNAWLAPSLILAILILVIGLIQTWRVPEKTNGLWILYLSFTPPTLLFLFSQWKPVYIERALLPSGIFFCIWLAWVFHNTYLSTAGRGLLSAMLAVSFMAGIYQHVTYNNFPYGPFKQIVSFLQESTQPGDVIIHSNKLSLLPSLYFDPSFPQEFIGDPVGSTTDTLAPATQQVLKIEAKTDIRSASDNAKRVWYIIYQRSIDEYIQVGKPTHPDIEYLNSEYTLTSQTAWDDLKVLLYTKNP